MCSLQVVAHDPRLDVDVRALIAETRELAAGVAKDVPSAWLALTPAALAVYDAYLADALTPDVMENIAVLITATLAARQYWIDRLGHDPYREHRGRRLDVLRRIEVSFSPQIPSFSLSRTDNLPAAGNYVKADLVEGSSAVTTTVDDRELIGANIRLARKLAGETSQPELARRLNERLGTKITVSHISRWENGHRTPSLETMRAVAIALGRSRGWFYDEHPELINP